ncbi:hypothetical protein SAMN05216389_101147 [Oceanobacillus limi]|uniref:ATP-dependent Lon protease n=1 Tax=Oceanobacillus limi TaxID=930131 RepID=A0A1H9Y2L2_9BACI|nr:hypothetical protein [Oceanobacillus limi]SES62976.1 hypothetical protein SAMN05216389_101147 [Oceanobacillus limi]
MYLLISIILGALLGYVLLIMGPLVGGIIAFGIVVGCLFRGLYLLNEIHKKIAAISPHEDKVQRAYREYLEEKK